MSDALTILQRFSIITDTTSNRIESMQTIEYLMKDHWLTSYDDCYVELAMRLQIPIATLDREILSVMEKIGIDRA